jgi:hypothetical protein
MDSKSWYGTLGAVGVGIVSILGFGMLNRSQVKLVILVPMFILSESQEKICT